MPDKNMSLDEKRKMERLFDRYKPIKKQMEYLRKNGATTQQLIDIVKEIEKMTKDTLDDINARSIIDP